MKESAPLAIVTGAFSFSGKYIAARLLSMGERVRTLTNRAPGGATGLEAAPLDFSRPQQLAASMRGATVLYNTYWVRFPYAGDNHERAVENIRTMLRAAKEAGVERVVHLSVANPSLDSPLSYFRGKALAEKAVRASGLSYAILRPALHFGKEDILINNIAWLLRRFPLFAIPGDGRYRVQPIFVEDLADLAVKMGHGEENVVLDAVGPETYTYEELVRLIAQTVRSHSRIVRLPPKLVGLASWLLGLVVRDVVLTSEEVEGLMADLLVSQEAPTGNTSLRAWLAANAQAIGQGYASELRRHFTAAAAR